jgi:hypothetical protein
MVLQRRRGKKFSPSGESLKSEIPLSETIESLRAQLGEAIAAGSDQEIQFPVDGIELEFHVGVTRNVGGGGGLRFWVVELGATTGYSDESIHTLKVILGAPVDQTGETVKIRRNVAEKP